MTYLNGKKLVLVIYMKKNPFLNYLNKEKVLFEVI